MADYKLVPEHPGYAIGSDGKFWSRKRTPRTETSMAGGIRGEKHHAAKITEETVRQIRRRAAVESFTDIASSVGLTDVMVGKIVRREWWKHVGDEA